jgi:lipopolysaccharide exporter
MFDPEATQRTAGRQMLHGSAWLIGLRWAVRLTGVLSTVILARLLAPTDFGVVAIAMIVVGLFEMLSWTGQELAIIRHATPTSEHYNTAWTISALLGIGIAAVIYLIAPLADHYFLDPRAPLVIRWLSLRPLLSGFENVGTVNFQRDLKFNRVFGYNFYAKLVAFIVTISLALLLRNYWALVAGILIGQMSRTLLSYCLHPYRPWFSLTKRSEIWSFSIWSLLRAIGTYFVMQIDLIVIGGAGGASQLGGYTVAKDVASSPVEELNEPVSSVLFPVMSRYQEEPEQLRLLYLRALGWAAVIGASAGVGVSLVSQDIVALILGSKWLSIIPLMSWLALTSGVAALTNSAFIVLDVKGLPQIGARMQWIRVLLMAAALIPVAYITHDFVRVAQVRLFVTLLFVPPLLFNAGRRLSLEKIDYVSAIWRPIVAGAVMALTLSLFNATFAIAGLIRLGANVAMGATVFLSALLILWKLSGKPLSAESDIVALYREFIRDKLIPNRVSKMGQ